MPVNSVTDVRSLSSVDVLLVEDDDRVAVPLVDGLRREGYAVTRVSTVAEALARFRADAPEFVLLDLGLPDGDGLDVCRLIRADSAVPIIMLTARDTEAARVEGLELGADDYLVKPFGLRELVARMRAVGRRTGSSGQGREPVTVLGPTGQLVIDGRTGAVTLDGAPLELTRREHDLLVFLADDPGRLYERTEILERVWSPHWYGPTKTLDVHVAALRRKLGDVGWIETVRSVGYRLAPIDGAEASR